MISTSVKAFCREALPPASSFYRREFPKVGRPSRQGWALVRCCFHPKDRNPSLSINLVTGGFNCFACGVRGGDLVDFVMRRDGIDFKTACMDLGAWSEVSEADRRRLDQQRLERERKAFIEHTRQEEQRMKRIETRDDLHRLERLYHRYSRRLSDLKKGAPEAIPNEIEVTLDVLAGCLPLIRIAAADYAELAGVSIGE